MSHRRLLVSYRLRWQILLLSVLLLLTLQLQAQVCGTPGSDGPGGTLSGIVNTYYPGTATANGGATSISIGSSSGASTPISIGDLLLVIQMQDAAINSNNSGSYGDGGGGSTASGSTNLNNSGRYEFVVATSSAGLGGGSVSIRGAGTGNGLINTYTNAAPTGSQGQRTFQVVRVPQYSSATLGSSLTAMEWDGSTGGILVFDVTGMLNLGGATVSVSGLGFRGGGGRALGGQGGGSNNDYRNLANNDYHGSKGEGIAGTPRYVYSPTTGVTNTQAEGYPNGSTARGAPGTAGGGGTDGNTSDNDENSGGGGGGNGGAGGKGGNTWNSNRASGGFGGAAFLPNATRMVMGGGGGAGSRNDSSGDASSGGPGGGIIMIRAGTVTGSGTLLADGSDGVGAENDGAGGGGAGGSVLVYANSGSLGSLTIRARGGNGADAWPNEAPGGSPGQRHGPGGGGGGGFVAVSAAATTSISGGTSGTTTTVNDAYNATGGAAGTSLTVTPAQIPGASLGPPCVPSLTTTKTTTTPNITVNASGGTATYTITVANATGRSSATNVAISDPLPANFTYASTSTVSLLGSATRPTPINPSPGDTTPVWGTFSIPAGSGVRITFVVNIAATATAGTKQNSAIATYPDPARTIANGTTTAVYSSASSTGEDVTLVTPPRVDLTKSVTPGGTQLPGTDLVYSIAFTNNGGRAATGLIVSDPIPASTDFKVGSATSTLATTGLTVAVSYSNDNGSSWTYTPVSGGGGAPAGYDRNVTNVRWVFTGSLSQTVPNNAGAVGFSVRIR